MFNNKKNWVWYKLYHISYIWYNPLINFEPFWCSKSIFEISKRTKLWPKVFTFWKLLEHQNGSKFVQGSNSTRYFISWNTKYGSKRSEMRYWETLENSKILIKDHLTLRRNSAMSTFTRKSFENWDVAKSARI